MNGSRLSDDDRARIRAHLAAGENVEAVARALGRHRQTVSRVKEDLERQDGTRLAVKLNFRVTEAEHAHFLAAIRSTDLTVSEAIRHLVRQATSLLALQSPEMEAIAAARRDLAALEQQPQSVGPARGCRPFALESRGRRARPQGRGAR